MGGIGIWAMHFVGNRAIVLDRGHPQRQILYNKGFTAASFFLPIIVLLFAFYTLGTSAKARQLQVAAAGVLTGAAVCGMHYMGQLGIANYNCSYRPQNVVGAAIISVVASLISLSLFFRMRDKWTDVWWKRTLCAVVLAIAVSGMHWTAAIGTIYHWRGDLSVHGDSRTTTSVATSCLVSHAHPSVSSRLLTACEVNGFLHHASRGYWHPRTEEAQRQNHVTATGACMLLFRRQRQFDGDSGRSITKHQDYKPIH